MEHPPRVPDQAAVTATVEAASPPRRRPVWGVPVVGIALALIAILFVVGFTGLFSNPVKSVNANGVATLSGSFEPYQCDHTSCDGYISAGARSVFVVFPRGCAPPARGAAITVSGTSAPDLGNASYRATACA